MSTNPPPRRLSPCPCGSGRRYKDCHGAFPSQEAIDLNIQGLLRQAARDLDGAIGNFHRALELAPQFPEAHLNLGLALLLQGDYANGWREFEWRTRVPGYADYAHHPFGMPRWQGEPLASRRLLVHAEQGHGDTIQFARFIARLAADGAEVDVFCHEPLVPLMGRMPGVHRAFGGLAERPTHDFHATIIDAGVHYLRDLESVHWSGPYLEALPDRVAQFAPALQGLRGPRIGIAWKGSPRHTNDHNRSLTRDLAAGLIAGGASFVSLQVGEPPLDAGSAGYLDLGGSIGNWEDTAGIIKGLDLVVCVDTAVAHLAGAMGKPVWMLVPFSPDWRWGLSGERTRWYPRMRLFRQERPGEWGPVIERIVAGYEAEYGPRYPQPEEA